MRWIYYNRFFGRVGFHATHINCQRATQQIPPNVCIEKIEFIRRYSTAFVEWSLPPQPPPNPRRYVHSIFDFSFQCEIALHSHADTWIVDIPMKKKNWKNSNRVQSNFRTSTHIRQYLDRYPHKGRERKRILVQRTDYFFPDRHVEINITSQWHMHLKFVRTKPLHICVPLASVCHSQVWRLTSASLLTPGYGAMQIRAWTRQTLCALRTGLVWWRLTRWNNIWV